MVLSPLSGSFRAKPKSATLILLSSVSFYTKLTFNSAIGRDKHILAFDVSMDKTVLV